MPYRTVRAAGGRGPLRRAGRVPHCVYAGPVLAGVLPLVPGARVRRDERFEYCDVLLD
jgi:hypothetical protein